MSLHVIDPGLQTWLVDLGRPKTRHLGVPLGGAADHTAMAIGNALVGNEGDAVALEITMSGPTLRADCPVHAVLFGAPFLAAIAGKGRIEPGSTFNLEAGDVVKIGGTPKGVRGYLCVAGGFTAPGVLGSFSSLEPLVADVDLPCRASVGPIRGLGWTRLPGDHPPSEVLELRVVPGAQAEMFLDPDQFYSQDFEVLPASNRMGIRLRGKSLERKPGEMVSEAVAPGAIQVTNEGQPIVIGVDGQTIGGYPKIAHVIRADLDELAQMRTGTHVRFRLVNQAEAATAWASRTRLRNEWQLRLKVTAAIQLATR